MQAVILAGGKATRLRPLTTTVPKPVIPLVDRPFLAYMLEWLRDHGVDDVIVSCGFLAAGVRDVIGDGRRYGVRVRYVEEPGPRGTGGAIKYAEHLLDERFLALNGDVLTDIDLTAQIARHEAAGARLTLGLVRVSDPRAYGLVRVGPEGAVESFSEKVGGEPGDHPLISAGAYVVEREVLADVPPDREVSIEREVFPRLVGGGLHAYVAGGYWLDIGTPDRYLDAVSDILSGAVRTRYPAGDGARVRVGEGAQVDGELVGPVLLGDGCVVRADAVVGPNVVLGARTRVEAGARVERSVILEDGAVEAGASVTSCIVAAGARIGARARLGPHAIVGPGASVGADEVLGKGARVEAAGAAGTA